MIETLEATPETFDAAIAPPQAGGLVVAYFWGKDCPNCEVFARHWPRLRETLEGEGVAMRFLKVNAYDHPELAKRFGIYGIPTFVLFREGKLLGRMSSFQGDEYFLGVVRERA